MTIIENPGVVASGFYDALIPSSKTVVRNIVEDVEELLEVPTAKDYYWFHCTTHPEWLDQVKDAGVWVHIGLVETASVISDEYRRCDVPSVMHRLVLSDDARIHPELFEDHNEWPREVGEARNDPEFSKHKKWDAFRYVNSYETPGFISLLVNPAVLSLVDTEVLDF